MSIRSRRSRGSGADAVCVDNVYTDARLTSMAGSTTINLRTPLAQRALIDRAAQLQGKTRTEFMLEASREKAQRVLLDQTLIEVSPAQHAKFLALMDTPL